MKKWKIKMFAVVIAASMVISPLTAVAAEPAPVAEEISVEAEVILAAEETEPEQIDEPEQSEPEQSEPEQPAEEQSEPEQSEPEQSEQQTDKDKPEVKDANEKEADKKEAAQNKEPSSADKNSKTKKQSLKTAAKETANETKTAASEPSVVQSSQKSAGYANAGPVDNKTSLPDGVYTDFGWKWEGGTGKAKLTLEKIEVSGGKATGYFTASSSSLTHVYYLGHTSGNGEDVAYYDPATDSCGEGVKPITSQKVSFPVALNKNTNLACRSVAMSEPHWIQYNYTITIDESEQEELTDYTVNSDMTGLKVSGAALSTLQTSQKTTLNLTMSDGTFDQVYAGTAAQAVKNASSAIKLTGEKKFFIPVKTMNTAFDIAFYSTKDKVWHEAVMTVNDTDKTVTIKEGKKADYSAVTKAKKNVPKDLSGYAASRVKALKNALNEVQEGLYASQQSVVDGYAKKIQSAIDALEKNKLTIRFQAVDKKTGKKISNASFVVKNKAGKTVKADKAGVYSLEDGSYTITAKAKNYEDAVKKNYKPAVEETVTLELEPAEVIPAGTTVFKEYPDNPDKTNLFNTTGMFKVVRGVLVSKGGKRTLTVTLNGQGYHYLYKGTYEQAMKNGLNKRNWIKGTQNAEGKWEFVIPLEKGETDIPIISISQSHLEKVQAKEENLSKALFARQLVLDTAKMTLTAGDYDANIDVKVISRTSEFQVNEKGKMRVVGSPSSNNYACKPVITMTDARFTKAFIGTAKDAAKQSGSSIALSGSRFRFSFENTFGATGQVKTFEDKKPIAVAFYDSAKKKWVDYKLTIDKENATVTIAALKADEKPPAAPTSPGSSDPSGSTGDSQQTSYADDSNVGTSSVDNATTLTDGTYTPSAFRFSGGTGRIQISCTKIEVRGGQAYATIQFAKAGGGAASVDSLRAAGTTFSGSNVFTIPVKLNANNTIVARTTAMSQPHWISYTIYIALAEPGKEVAENGLAEASAELDTEAPAIIGMTTKGTIETPYSDLVSIFEYEEGFYLIEVDVVKDTARDTEEYRKKQEEARAASEKAEEEQKNEQNNSSDTGLEDGQEAAEAESMSKHIAELYSNDILKYLVVPADAEVPAGLDKEVLIIRQPADRTFISSPSALDLLGGLKVEENITSCGIPDEDIDVPAAGTYDKWDLKTMVLGKTNFVLESSEILPQDEKTVDEDVEAVVKLGLRASQMDLAMFIDRSADEENELAKAEWYKVYGIIYNVPRQGQNLYQKIENAASKEEKDAALKRLKLRAAQKTNKEG